MFLVAEVFRLSEIDYLIGNKKAAFYVNIVTKF